VGVFKVRKKTGTKGVLFRFFKSLDSEEKGPLFVAMGGKWGW